MGDARDDAAAKVDLLVQIFTFIFVQTNLSRLSQAIKLHTSECCVVGTFRKHAQCVFSMETVSFSFVNTETFVLMTDCRLSSHIGLVLLIFSPIEND